MLNPIPGKEEMTALVGESLYAVWNRLCALIDEKYDMDRLWNHGGKAWKYEYKYRRGGKTLCALYARENCVGFMVILGRDERLKFEADREHYTKECRNDLTKPRLTMTGNGSCLSRWIPRCFPISSDC